MIHLGDHLIARIVWVDLLRLGLVFTIVQTGVPFLVEHQSFGASDTSDSGTVEASDILVWVVWVSNVSAEFGSTVGAFVWAFEGGGWVPFLCSNTFVFSVVQTLVAWFTEFEAQWPAGLTVS